MNTNNKTVREKAMYYWNQQISEFGQYTLTSTHYPDRHPLSLTGREIEKIYLSEHPEENEETKFSKHWWNGLNYRTRKELADAYTDNSGSVDAALMMDDETIERIYQSEHPKEQTKGVIEGLEDANNYFNKKRRRFTGINAGDFLDEEDFISYANSAYSINLRLQEQNNNLLELCRELYVCYLMNQYREAHNLGLSDERRDEIMNANPTIIKAKQLLKQ